MARDEVDPELVAELTPIVQDFLPALGRPAWTPVVADDDGGDLGSRYGGKPWIGFGFAWPACPSCKQPMQHFVQLDLASLPAELAWPHRHGLIQLFYCTTSEPLCEVDCEAYLPFARSALARWVPPDRVEGTPGIGRVPDNQRYPHRNPGWKPVRVTGWQRSPSLELPGYEEAAWQGREAYEDREYEILDVIGALDLEPASGDKLAGWPAWVQSPERPSCPRCGATMEVLLQVESNGHSGHQFGDLGAGHITQCPAHADVVAFAWACH